MNTYKIIFRDGSRKLLNLRDYESLRRNLNRRIIEDVEEVWIKVVGTKKYAQCPKPI